MSKFTTDSAARKRIPIASGVLDYFPRALAAVAEVSLVGNDKHNPGQPLHWAKHKSTDQADCIARHLIERGGMDENGVRHSAQLAWRALALLEEEIARDEGTWDGEVEACRTMGVLDPSGTLLRRYDQIEKPVPPYATKPCFCSGHVAKPTCTPEECKDFDGHVYSGGECLYCEAPYGVDESEDVKEERKGDTGVY